MWRDRAVRSDGMESTLVRVGRTLADLLYPPRCAVCREPTLSAQALCATCWRDVAFIAGTVCDACGTPLPEGLSGGRRLLCTDCHARPPAWRRGRAAVLYDGAGRRLVLQLKHADRLDLALPLAAWMARAGAELIAGASLIAPVPLHWLRLARRRFNQSAELARHLARAGPAEFEPRLLRRRRSTPVQEGRTRTERFENLAGAIAVRPAALARLRGARVLLVDDVMTTGATLSACAEACLAGGAASVDVLVAARVDRTDWYRPPGRTAEEPHPASNPAHASVPRPPP
jgi:ComF family protein